MYLQLKAVFNPDHTEYGEIIQAMLQEFPFDTFTIEGNELLAYGNLSSFESIANSIIEEQIAPWILSIHFEQVEKENWNTEWEKNYFQPIWIKDKVCIFAPFHKLDKQPEIPIVIEPKMSFGTGHHATTLQMCEFILQYRAEIAGKSILDMGAGTGVLAILAAKVGAKNVVAIDIEDWCQENAAENFERNSISNWQSHMGNVTLLSQLNQTFDIILANIQRNVLLQDTHEYINYLNPAGYLFVSGFNPQDCNDIITNAYSLGLKQLQTTQQGEWCAIAFQKI